MRNYWRGHLRISNCTTQPSHPAARLTPGALWVHAHISLNSDHLLYTCMLLYSTALCIVFCWVIITEGTVTISSMTKFSAFTFSRSSSNILPSGLLEIPSHLCPCPWTTLHSRRCVACRKTSWSSVLVLGKNHHRTHPTVRRLRTWFSTWPICQLCNVYLSTPQSSTTDS